MQDTKRRNTFRIVGYLKENNLVEENSSFGGKQIRGSVTIVTNNENAFKVNFKKKEGSNKYEEALNLLPEYTTSIASYLKSTPTATYGTAIGQCTKIWAIGSLEEYCYKETDKETGEEKEVSNVMYKALAMGLAEDSTKVFAPNATFEVDAFIANKKPEVKDGKETGRINILALVPAYMGNLFKLTFIAGEKNNAADYVNKNYDIKDTVFLKGELYNMSVRTEVKKSNKDFWGDGGDTTVEYETTFIKENIITGGGSASLKPGDKDAISLEEIEKGLKVREEKVAEASKSHRTRPATAPAGAKPSAPQAPAKAPTPKAEFDGLDF